MVNRSGREAAQREAERFEANRATYLRAASKALTARLEDALPPVAIEPGPKNVDVTEYARLFLKQLGAPPWAQVQISWFKSATMWGFFRPREPWRIWLNVGLDGLPLLDNMAHELSHLARYWRREPQSEAAVRAEARALVNAALW